MAQSHIASIKRELECQAQNKSSASIAYKSEVKNTGGTFVCHIAGHGVNQKV